MQSAKCKDAISVVRHLCARRETVRLKDKRRALSRIPRRRLTADGFNRCALRARFLFYPAAQDGAPSARGDSASRNAPCGASHFSRSAQSDLSAFISFLSRERKETKQRKETAGRAKFACTPGALPLDFKCYRRMWHFPFETSFLAYHLKSRDAEERPPSGESTGLATGKFCTAGPSYPAQLGTQALKLWRHFDIIAPTGALLCADFCGA